MSEGNAALEFLRAWMPLVTPFAVLGLGFWMNARASSRKALMESIDGKIGGLGATIETKTSTLAAKLDAVTSHLTSRIDDGNEDCRKNIGAVQEQVRAFQVEVGRLYPSRTEFEARYNEIREDLRDIARGRGGDRGD